MNRKVYQRLASALQARTTCAATGNNEWFRRHTDTIIKIASDFLPSGSGIDAGTKFDFENSHSEKLVLTAPFHHMNAHGYYDGWTEHQIVVTPSLAFGINIRITGRNKNDIKDYLGEVFQQALTQEITDKQFEEVAQ